MTILVRSLIAGMFLFSFLGSFVISKVNAAEKETPPKIKVKNVRAVVSNGQHNAFTDLCKFRGKFYLTFRNSPTGHAVNSDSKVVILSSPDAQTWEEVYSFSVPDRDTRDPHFLIFQEKLFVYSGTWFCTPRVAGQYEFNEHLGYGVWSADGKKWSKPIMLEGTYGHYIWKAATHEGKAYLCGRRKQEFAATDTRADRDRLTESALLVSDDGLIFRTQGLFQSVFGNETDFLFEANGDITAVARCGGGKPSQVCRAKPPYTQFTQKDLSRHIGGPMLEQWGSWQLVGGRKVSNGKAVTALAWLVGDDLQEQVELPSGGDNSYPGFVQLDDRHALLSYYSSHEAETPTDPSKKKPSSIYLAELELIE